MKRMQNCNRCDYQDCKCYGFQEGAELWREKQVTTHFRDKYKWDKEMVWVTLDKSLSWAGVGPGLHTPLCLFLYSFSSMGCGGPRVLVLITDERCRAWTPGLTSQHDSLWDRFSPDGTAWLALSPHIKSSTCGVLVRCEPCGCQAVKLFCASWWKSSPCFRNK